MNTFVRSALGASYFTRDEEYDPVGFVSRAGVETGRCDEETDSSWDRVIDELLAARGLDDDWDGQGAKAPSYEAVDTTLRLAVRLKQSKQWPPDDYGAGVDGTVTLGWHSGPSSVVIEVSSPLRIIGHRWRKGDDRAERFTVLAGQ